VKQLSRCYFLGLALILATSSLTSQVAREDTLKEIQRQIVILTEEIERMKLGEVAETKYEPSRGLGPAASKVYQLKKTGVSLAGYGEVVYENYAKKRDDGTTATTKDKVDFLRNVVYVGFRFNDWIVFNSEVEFEHASTGKGGEVSVEFGYVELMFSPNFNLRAGMVLPPVGIVNEKHEPSTFFGTLRPQVERLIIPSTWRTNGFGAYGEIVPSLNYRAYIVEGFNAKKFSASDGIRGGRQSGANALAENFGVTGKVEYDGFPGGIVGASFYTGNSGQGATDSLGTVSASTTLISLHGEYAWQGLEVRALYATTSLDQAGRVSALAGATIGSRMEGWYFVAGYDVVPLFAPGSEHYLAPFVQFEKFNTQKEVDAGFFANKATDRSIFAMGLTYKPHPNVAFKVDYRDNKNAAGTGLNQWNLALAYLY
jgi:hypothetical protein